jgi:hypothetical protein
MASELTIGLNTTHTQDIARDEIASDTVIRMDTAPTMYNASSAPFGWKAAVGAPGDLLYQAGSKFKFTDGTATVYELISVANGAGTNDDWTIARENRAVGGLTENRATQERSEFEVGASASLANMDGEYYTVHHSSGTKYQIWFDGTGTTTAPTALAGYTLVKSDISGATDTQSGIATAHRLVIAAITDAPYGSSGGAGGFVEHKDSESGAAANIGIGTMDPGTIYTTQEGATVEMIIRPTCGSALGYGTGGGSDRRRRMRHLGY